MYTYTSYTTLKHRHTFMVTLYMHVHSYIHYTDIFIPIHVLIIDDCIFSVEVFTNEFTMSMYKLIFTENCKKNWWNVCGVCGIAGEFGFHVSILITYVR